jgi:hypothetical protein
MKVTLMNVRLAFPQLFEAKAFSDGQGEAYSASFIFPKGHPAEKIMAEAIEKVGSEKWGAKWTALKKELTNKDKTALHDGDNKASYAGFPGNLFVSARSKVRPAVVDRDRSPITASDGKVYAGCYVNAIIDIYPQDNAYGKRVNATLKGVQFYADGDAFSGGAPASADDFPDLSVDEAA